MGEKGEREDKGENCNLSKYSFLQPFRVMCNVIFGKLIGLVDKHYFSEVLQTDLIPLCSVAGRGSLE